MDAGEGRHVHDFKLHSIRPQEVDGVIAADPKREFARTIQDRPAELAHQARRLINFIGSIDVEGHMVQPGCVDLEPMLREIPFRLPDVEGDSGVYVQVDRQPCARVLSPLVGRHSQGGQELARRSAWRRRDR